MKRFFIPFILLRELAAEGTTGTGGGQTQGVANQLPAGQTAASVPNFDPRFNIDTRDPNQRNKRPPDYQALEVTDVREYRDQRTGSPRIAFNQGAVHISLAQLQSAGVHYPRILFGKTIMVDFFKPGDILLNGSVVTDDGRIVNRFVVEQDMQVARDIEKELAMDSFKGFRSLMSQRYGANTRGTGEGTQLQNRNGVQNANGGIPQMGSPTQRFAPGLSPSNIQQQDGGRMEQGGGPAFNQQGGGAGSAASNASTQGSVEQPGATGGGGNATELNP